MKKKMRTLGLMALIPTLAVTLTACASGSDSATSESVNTAAPLAAEVPDSLKDKTELIAASDIPYSPFEYYEDDGTTLTGVDVDIAKLVSDQIGIPITFKQVTFDSIIPGLAAGQYDLAWTGIGNTPERAEQVDFVDYFKSGYTIFVKSGLESEVTGLDSLCGRKVGVQSGTTSETDANEQKEKCATSGNPMELTTFKSNSDISLAITNGKVDVGMATNEAARDLADKSNGQIVKLDPYRTVNFGIAFEQGQSDVLTLFQKALENIKADGSYQQVLDKYNLSDSALDEFSVSETK